MGSCHVCFCKKINNLYVVIDRNGWQGIGKTKDILNLNLLKDKWKSFGWNCFEINGHNFNQIQKVFKKKITNDTIIANTIKVKEYLLWKMIIIGITEFLQKMKSLRVKKSLVSNEK